MSSWGPEFGAAAADIDDAFATATIRYTPRGGAQGPEIKVIPIERGGDDPFGEGRSVKQQGYEIAYAKLTGEPGNGDTVTEATAEFAVIEVEHNREAAAWVVMVEKRS